MAITAGDIYVRSGDSGAFTDVQYVKGGWITVDSGSDMTSLDPTRLSDGQIVYVRSEEKTYVCNYFTAFVTPGYSGFSNSASFAEFNFPSTITGVTAGDGLSGGGIEGTVTLNLNTGSAHFTEALQAINYAGIFKQTGSVYSTTNDLEITGSLKLELDGVSDYFSVDINGVSQVKVNEEGVLQFGTKGNIPTAITGGLYYSSSNDYYLGFLS